jgi:cell division protein FtsL
MKSSTMRISAALAVVALATAGCSSLTPGENAAVFGTTAGAATGIALGASGVPSYITVPTAIGAGALVAVTAYVIAKRQATVEQRKIAEARAQLYYAKLDAEKKAAMQKKKVRYIAVDTKKDNRVEGEKAVMVFDTQTQEIVGNTVYDVKTSPKVGQATKFDTYTAQYVGSGT